MKIFTSNKFRFFSSTCCFAIILFAATAFFSGSVNAQPKYGITSTTTVTPPYPITLDGFVAEGGTKISLQILPTDINISQYPVLLKLVISGNGITLESKSLHLHEPIFLNGNELVTLNGSDLQAFFNPDNLNFSGYSKTQYQRNGRLPEGVYSVRFELYDVLRPTQPVSTVNAYTVFLFLNEVPMLNLPLNGDLISAAGTQVVNFRWTTRHSPLAGTFFTPEYLFELWEIMPEGRNAYDVVKGTRPYYVTTLSSPYLAYGVAEPQLQQGRSYAWRVRETDPENRTLFKNDGYTEVYTFTYGRNCPAPELRADKVGTSYLSVTWQADVDQKQFELRYRDKKKKNAEWYTQTSNLLSGRVDNLKTNTVYEVEVCGICGDQRSDYSNRLEINTRQNTSFKCGQVDSSKFPQNKDPLRKLSPKDVFKAYGFDVEVAQATGGSGTFTGKGYVLVPLLNFIKIEVTFNNIQINDEYQLIGGEVKTVYNLKNSLTFVPGEGVLGLSEIDALTKLLTGDEEKNKFNDIANKTVSIDSVKEVKIEGDKIVITDANGKKEEVSTSSGKIVAIKTEEGKEYVVDTSNGTIYSSGNSGQKAPEGSPSGSVTTAAQAGKGPSPKYNVSFIPHKLQEYGFDYPTGKSPAANYEQVEITGKPSLVPWKSLETGRIERLVADITGGPADSVRYYRESNNVVMTAPGEKATQHQVMLNGTGKNDEDKLFAWYAAYNGDTAKTYNRILAGQLNMVSYEKVSIKIVLVPVNNSSCPEPGYVRDELNKIYKSAVVNWDVQKANSISVTFPGATFDNTDADDRMDYTADMKAVKDVMKDDAQYNRETYYLFFLDNAKDQAIKGYMPLKQQFGFIFKYKQYPDEYLRTIAHELGHGPFRLWHTFSSSNKYVQSKGSTDNLMDYLPAPSISGMAGVGLYKYQWDWMHDPEWRLYWFTEEDEGEDLYFDGSLADLRKLINSDLKTFTFITPAGTRIALPIGAKYPVFAHNLTDISKSKIVIGTLTGFVSEDGIQYDADITGDGLVFKGYIDKAGKPYKDKYTEGAPNNTVLMLFPCKHGGHMVQFNCAPLDYAENLPSAVKSEIDFPILEFNAAEEEKRMIKFNYLGTVEEGREITPEEKKIIGNKCVTSNIIYLHKIAALRNLYPTYFEDFTDHFNSWNHLPPKMAIGYNPIYSSVVEPVRSEWDRKMRDNDQYRKSWKNNEATFYELFISEFKAFIKEGNDRKNQILSTLSLETTSYRDAVYLLLSSSDEEIGKISAENKIILLKILTKGDPLNGNKLVDFTTDKIKLEAQALKLFTTTTDLDDKNILLVALITYKDGNNEDMLLHSLCKDVAGFDNPEFTNFVVTLYNWLSESRPCNDGLFNLMVNSKEKAITFAPTFLRSLVAGRELYCYFNDNKEIVLLTESKYEKLNGIKASPYECIVINFKDDYTIGEGKTFHKGQKLRCPAILGYLLFNNAAKKNMVLTAKLALDLALFAVGVGEVTAAVEAANGAKMTFQLTKAIIDIGFSVSDIVITDVFAESLEKSENGRNFLSAWNKVQLMYGVASISDAAYEMTYNILRKEGKQLISEGKLYDSQGNVTQELTEKEKQQITQMVDEAGQKTGLSKYGLLKDFTGEIEAPAKFKGALNKMGVSVDNFMNEMPLEHIEKLADYVSKNANGATLDEIFSVYGMTRTEYYASVNSALRAGQTGGQIEDIVKLIDDGLAKMPTKEATFYAGLSIKDPTELENFLKQHEVDKTVPYKGYTFSSTNIDHSFYNDAASNIRITIKGKNGIDLHDISYNTFYFEKLGTIDGKYLESVFKRNTNFKVVSKKPNGTNYEIVLEEVAGGVAKGGGKIDLLTEEALGGHSIARHGHQLSLAEMEQRVLGTHPTVPQSRSALRFETQAIHEDAVNKAYEHYADEIEAYFKAGGDKKDWTFDYGSKVGSGYTNNGTLKNPVVQAVSSSKVTIIFVKDASSPKGFKLLTAYPDIK